MLPGGYFALMLALVWVVFSDLLYRRISNRLVLCLLVLWLAHPLMAALGFGSWLQQPNWLQVYVGWPLLGAVLVLLVGYALFAIGRVGAGDVKLMAVLMLWAGPQGVPFLMVTSLLGGVLALAMPLLGMLELALAHGVIRLNAVLPGSKLPLPLIFGSDRPKGIPYGLAIAAGMFCVLKFRMV